MRTRRQHRELRRVGAYGVAVASSLAALGLTLVLLPYIDRARFSLLFGAVLLTGWLGGMGPGILAVGCTVVLRVFCQKP